MWAFVGRKEANCDRSEPDGDHKGSYWDHVALDPEHRLVLEVVPGARTIENTEALVANARRRTGGRLMNLLTSDAYPAYETAIRHAYGEIEFGAVPPPPDDPPLLVADVRRLGDEVGWTPRFNLRDGLAECLRARGIPVAEGAGGGD